MNLFYIKFWKKLYVVDKLNESFECLIDVECIMFNSNIWVGMKSSNNIVYDERRKCKNFLC